MKKLRTGNILGWIAGALVFTMVGCINYTIPGRDSGQIKANSCEGCHTDYERLVAVHSPDTALPAGGCGGEAPHYEPYDRVFMGGEGYDAYKASAHSPVGCTGCHNGNGDTGEKAQAHSGDFISHPSTVYQEKCGTCHQEITQVFTTSIHNGTGQKRKVAMRSGLSGADEFDQLPAHQIEGYNKNCAHCHGTCGNCHVVRPASGGGGLSAGHNFNKTPSMINVCVACHTSRGGHAYLGVAPGTQPDVHLTGEDFECIACHDGHELHGDGQPVEQRYAYTELPDCEDCHQDLGNANNYHTIHYTDFNCHVCHSQDYNNCGSCHIHGEGARIPAYLGFKIAVNPIPDIKGEYDLALVRRTLAAPDNWKEYGVEEYADFDVFPTYNYTSPHNLLRWTGRTQVESGACSMNCHIRKEGDSLINKELYLFKADLLEWELGATGFITMDDRVPPSWLQ
jgi:thiosulfate/3-mercaptopyruvate sulfurtransferase